MEYEKCYVYEPEDHRPAKRRKVEPQGLHGSWNVRREAYETAWGTQEAQFNVPYHLTSGTTRWA